MESPYEFSFVLVSLRAIIKALPVTAELTLIPLVVGIILGLPFAIVRRFRVPVMAVGLSFFSNVIKGIPAILLVLMTNYLILKPIDFLAQTHSWAVPLQSMDKIYIGITALSLYSVVQITESFISALSSVDAGQYEAAYSVGLSRRQTLTRIVLPQAIPAALPLLCNNFIGLIKSSSIVYLISVNDILGAAINSAAINFRYLEAYIAVALVYWVICATVERSFIFLERKYMRVSGGAV